MKNVYLLAALLITTAVSLAQATVYTGVMDSRAGQQFIPGMTAQSKAWISGGDSGEGVRLEWQADNVNTPGSWTYTYRLLRGTVKNKGFAFFDIETASDFTAANILSKQVTWALTKTGTQLAAGLAGVTISDPLNFDVKHVFSNETPTGTPLNKTDHSHYSGDPGRVAPGLPGLDASLTPSVGPVFHPFYGIRVTFPGTLSFIAYEAVEWEFKIVSDRPPMWGSFFGWGDQTLQPPYWYSNMYNNNIRSEYINGDIVNPVRLTLPPTSCNFGESPCQGWILVPGSLPAATASFLTVDRATYSRDASGAGVISMFATAGPDANRSLTVSGAGFVSPAVMTQAFNPGDPATTPPVPSAWLGKYFASIPYSSLPASVLLENRLITVSQTYPVPLVDEVEISQAIFNSLTREITIKAASQDRMAPLPTLTAIDFAAPNQFDQTGTFTGALLASPPTTVTVISSKGGSATARVNVVTPAPVSLTITAAAAPNGTISPAGATSVVQGANQSYTITPNAGFQVTNLVVDGTVLPGATSYTFTSVTTDHYINAYFGPIPAPVTITAAAAPNGAISPAGAASVASGSDLTYTIIPDAGFTVINLVVDGTLLPGATSYTFTNVTADHYINAYFGP